jgi:hypothetical protein
MPNYHELMSMIRAKTSVIGSGLLHRPDRLERDIVLHAQE